MAIYYVDISFSRFMNSPDRLPRLQVLSIVRLVILDYITEIV